MSSIFTKVHHGVESVFGDEKHSHAHVGHVCDHLHPSTHRLHRFHSFAPRSEGNIKWFVDGASYFWAVSEALQRAQESIFILDWWLSPELYLRRPPAQNEQYRLDVMLKAAAERGVDINIVVYKEVEAALNLDSLHTKHALEKLHPNIKVFRHPDHVLTAHDIKAELGHAFSSLTTFDLSKASEDTVKAVYGAKDEVVLFWAHHEKLLVVDRKLGFMGGLDLCFGRWDTNSHPTADAHPANLDAIVFPGQDFNNARVFDFYDVQNWDQNPLDRTKSCRMGWSDVALSMSGPIVDNLVEHFVDRWNFVLQVKYGAKEPGKYKRLSEQKQPSAREAIRETTDKYLGGLSDHFNRGMSKLTARAAGGDEQKAQEGQAEGEMIPRIQLTRSCGRWSSGHRTEHSIANAYIHAIHHAEHFIYIENQFFITATCREQHPVANKLGAAIVDRIVRAHQQEQPFKMWVVMPAVPAFPGDLRSDDALGTRGIMKYQYNSISRGGHSIMETLREAGIEDPGKYIGFYNLRTYDRINKSRTMDVAEKRGGVSYEDARKQHDDKVDADANPAPDEDTHGPTDRYAQYKEGAAQARDGTMDSISPCYMDGGPSVADLPWDGEPGDEMAAFVSEELYIHSKLLIADDRLVICGSANLNDRSQLGTHDSEIAVVIEDPNPVESVLNGEPYLASRFATSLRRYIFRKHLGLLPDQPCDQPDDNWHPIDHCGNHYDWDSPGDLLVRDVMHRNFENLWTNTARKNTEIFSRAFHNVPNDQVRTWADYEDFFSKHFIVPKSVPKKKDPEAEKKVEEAEVEARKKGKVDYGHVVAEEFSAGGVQELKEWLGGVRGTVVDMPLQFLADVKDIAKEGLALNSLTDEIYT